MLKRIAICMMILGAFQLSAGIQQKLIFQDYMNQYSKDRDDTEVFRQILKDMRKNAITSLYIPAGTYFLTDTIDISCIGNGEIHADNYAEFVMKDAQKDIFYSRSAWKLRISGLSFEGGRNQLAIGNSNTDRTVISIQNCKFQKASGFAIHLGEKTYSAQVSISDCSFYLNNQVLYNHSDWTILRDSWITTSPRMRNCGVIVNYGCLTLDHVLGVPLVAKPKKETRQRWIDHYGSKLTCRDVRFGGEDGGLPIVYNFKRLDWKYPMTASSILLTDCWLYCAGNEAIRFFEIPNRVRIENCTGLIDAKFFSFSSELDQDFLRKHLTGRPDLMKIETVNTPVTFISDVPEILRNQITSSKIKFVQSKENKDSK